MSAPDRGAPGAGGATPPAASPARGGATSPVAPARRAPFQYAALRVVPRVERGEAVNAGVVLFCRPLRFLGAKTHLDEALLRAVAPGCDPSAVGTLLTTMERIAAGDESGGPIAQLPQSERFHWLVAPASTIVQPGPVHTGLTSDPNAELARLFVQLVER